MAKTVVGVFDNFSDAQAVVRELRESGFSSDDISLIANNAKGEFADYDRGHGVGSDKMDDTAEEQAGSGAVAGAGIGAAVGLLVGVGLLAIPGVGPVLAAGPIATALGSTALGAGIGAAAGGLVGPLVDAGVPRPEAETYSETVRRGGTLVMVRASDDMAQKAVDIMNRHNVVDIDDRSTSYRSSGWSGFDVNAEPYKANQIDEYRTSAKTASTTPTAGTASAGAASTNKGEAVLPVVEEELQVGKRQVQRGGARIHTHVTERPVEEQVRLREETVHVERRPVDRPVTAADEAAFREQSIEMTETAEEAVVAKQARVVEEVVVGKDVNERTETIRDTVRRTDVDVEQIDAGQTMAGDGFSAYDADFRRYYASNVGNSGYTYEQYNPVFRYGYNLAGNERYHGKDWSAIESDARKRWEEKNPGTWEQFKDSIRYAWDRARNKI